MTTAESAVAAAETLEPGQPWAEPVRAAEAAIDELRAAATAALFPTTISPIPSDAFAALTFFAGRMLPGPMFGTALGALHANCIRTWPALADLIRAVVLPDVATAAASQAMVLARPGHELAREAVERFQLDVAHQIAGADGHPLAGPAGALVASSQLGARLAAAEALHRAHAAVELERAEKTRQAIETARGEQAGREAQEASAEAAGHAEAARVAAERARRLRNAALAARLRHSKLQLLPVGGRRYALEELTRIAAADGFSDEQIVEFDGALDAVERGAA